TSSPSSSPHHITDVTITTTATTYNTTMAAFALAVILATQPPQQHPKGARLIFVDATWVFDCGLAAATTKGAFVFSRTPTGCVRFTADPKKVTVGCRNLSRDVFVLVVHKHKGVFEFVKDQIWVRLAVVHRKWCSWL
nr:hypothetical protein [Tanacetum cinerariifolium]